MASAAGEGPTARLARRSAELRFEDLPPHLVTVVQHAVADTVGVALAGTLEPVTAIVVGVAAAAPGRSSRWAPGWPKVDAATAALVNGTAAHALDFDDMLPFMQGHPSATVVPVAVALGEELGASGADVVTAVAAGIEVQARVGAAVLPSHYERGFHPTGTAATFGTAAAAASLLHLDPAQTEMALGVAASQASGLRAAFGTMVKPLHAGRAAADGLLAARLAAAGLLAPGASIERAQGFAAAYADGLDLDALDTEFGSPWATLATVVKRHASCGYTHSVIEAVLAVRPDVAGEEVTRIDATVHPEVLSAADIREPATALQAKFSVRFVAALAAATGRVDADQFTATLPADSALQRLAARVEPVGDPALPRLTARVTVHTASGRSLTAERDCSQPLWRLDPAEQGRAVAAKFRSLVTPVLGSARTTQLLAGLTGLSTSPDVRRLLA